MATFRCPKHHVIFESVTDSRPPGSRGNASLPDQPTDCHPDCPMKEKEGNTGVSAVQRSTRIA